MIESYRHIALILLFWITSTTTNSSLAQQKAFKFTHYGKQDGLNQSSVNAIFQDFNDYVWVANFGGVNRFDGYDFLSYANDFRDSTSISDNSVWSIYQCQDSSLWFGTKAGLSCYHPERNNFTNFYIRQLEGESTLAIKALFEDQSGRFYIGSEGEGLWEFIRATHQFKQLDFLPQNAKVSAISEDARGNLWIGTEQFGLFRVDSQRTQSEKIRQVAGETVWCVFTDAQNTVWIGTDSYGLYSYHSKLKKWRHHLSESQEIGYVAGEKIKSVTQGHQGEVWIGSATEGLSCYDHKEQLFYQYKKERYNPNSLFDNDVSSIFAGANGVTYVGYYMKGFDKLIESPFRVMRSNPNIQNSISNNNVYCLYKTKDGLLWIGTFGGGLSQYNPNTGQFKHFRYSSKDTCSISHDWVRIIYEDSKNRLWVGTWGGGLNLMDRTTGQFKRYLPNAKDETSLSLNIVTAVFEDSDGEIWVGTYGGGINIYQPETDNFRSIAHQKGVSNSLSDNHITSFYQDKPGIVWICTYGGGLNKYDKQRKSFKRFLPSRRQANSINNHKILHIFNEPDSNYYWVTTLGGGLNKFYPNSEQFYYLTESDGLANNSTMGMMKDVLGNYWVSTNHGISQFNPQKKIFLNFTVADGLGSDDYNLEAYASLPDGKMYFGGKNGITFFNPAEVKQQTHFPKVRFTAFSVDGEPKLGSVQLSIPYKSRVVFEYAAVNPAKSVNISYAYRLKGHQQAWIKGVTSRYLEFTDLTPGKYELQVKSTNSSHVWNQEYTSLSFSISPPWYMTWYARVGGVSLLIIAISGYYWKSLQRSKRMNVLLKQKVDERTKTIQRQKKSLEIEKSNTEKAYQELKKLESLKNELTGMIAHDLKNPLVTILKRSSGYQQNKDLGSIQKAGNVMLRLIENMLEVQKFEDASVQLRTKALTFRNVAHEAFGQVEILAKEKRISILNQVPPSLRVQGDPDALQRVLVNLLSNAIKFSATDSQIEIKAKKGIKEGLATASVKDQGKGISRKDLSRVFEKFAQLEARASGNIRSTGLGLTYCQMAVEAHGGEIWVESELGHGTEFFFTLTRLEDAQSEGNNDACQPQLFENKLEGFVLSTESLQQLQPYTEQISVLSIYEMGKWLDIFEKLKMFDNENLKYWVEDLQEALYGFDENAYSHLTRMAITSEDLTS